ncbi:MAG: UDP-2,4-diacetamido-2,4,6-trideoxy-beta-L-altropyranose hydrolase [Anaerophaga sp.]|nr:UDP-2,4-diacetamido-2,4,6-trideoxy-beta-L-altropyranose hydrolase [Anaerophaga sp.]
MKIAFITEANENIGFGHLYRSIALAQELISHNCEVDFYCDGNLSEKIIRENIVETNVFKISDFKLFIKTYTLAIIDVFKSSWSNYQWLTQLSDIKTASVIDYAFKEYAIPTDYIFQIGFQKYEFKETIKQNKNGKISKIYSGNDFFIFREEFKKVRTFEVRKNAKKILVSMGGSDPYNLTEFVTESLIAINIPLKVTLLLGAGVSQKRLTAINSMLLSSIHDTIILQNVNNIAKIMVENDFAIINGGNTRFELAILGVPFISVSFDNKQNNIADILQYQGIGKNIGIYENLNKEIVAKAIEQTIENYEERKIMSKQMKQKLSINGSQIFIDILTT